MRQSIRWSGPSNKYISKSKTIPWVYNRPLTNCRVWHASNLHLSQFPLSGEYYSLLCIPGNKTPLIGWRLKIRIISRKTGFANKNSIFKGYSLRQTIIPPFETPRIVILKTPKIAQLGLPTCFSQEKGAHAQLETIISSFQEGYPTAVTHYFFPRTPLRPLQVSETGLVTLDFEGLNTSWNFFRRSLTSYPFQFGFFFLFISTHFYPVSASLLDHGPVDRVCCDCSFGTHYIGSCWPTIMQCISQLSFKPPLLFPWPPLSNSS